MKLTRWLNVAVMPILVATGCQNMSNTDKGVLTGGALGAGAGALIGSATHNTAAGAALGGVLGAVAGGVTGNAIDNSEKKTQAQIAAANAQAHPPLALPDIATMAQQHIDDNIIIQQIRTTRSIYNLSPQDIEWLKANGVSDGVVLEMQATANRYPRGYYYTAAPVVQPVYMAPPPPVGVGIGFGYVHR